MQMNPFDIMPYIRSDMSWYPSRSSSVLTPHASQEILQSPKKSVTSPGNQAEADRDFGADALLVPDRPPPSQPPLAEPQISKVAILLAIEKVDAEIEAVNSKLAALAARIDSGRNRSASSYRSFLLAQQRIGFL